jgi:hypothetical protein
MESKESTSLYVQRVVSFLYVGSRRLLHNLTNMYWKPLAYIGLRVGMVPKLYHRFLESLCYMFREFIG